MKILNLFLLLLISLTVFSKDSVLSDYRFRIDKIKDGTDYIFKDFLNKKIVEVDYQLHKRFNDGYILFALKDYKRASMIFYDIATKKEFKDQTIYAESLYYLAKSFHYLKNYLGAREYYKAVLEHPSKRFYQEALEQLLEISYKIGDYRDISFYMKELQTGDKKIRPEIYYARGKSAYYQKEYKIAIVNFTKILKNSDLGLKSQYFIAISYTASGDYKKAIDEFKKVIKYSKNDKNSQYIKDQAILSIARLYYTIGDITKAIDSYQDLKRTSTLYDISLYESAWTFIKAKKYDKALYAIELLIDVLPNSDIIPEAILLKGNLFNKMDNVDKALETYSEVINRYAKISGDLNNIMEHNENLEDYFGQLLGTDLGKFSASKFLPPEAIKFVKSEKLVKRAQKIVKEIEQTQKYLDESNSLLETLVASLSNTKSVNSLFPKTDDVRARAFNYLNELIKMYYNLVEMLYRDYKNIRKDSSKEKIAELRLSRVRLMDIFKDIPSSEEGYKKRKSVIRKKYSKIEKRGYQLKIRVGEMKKQIDAMEKLFAKNMEKYKYSESKKQLFYDQIEQKKKKINRLENKILKISKEVSIYKKNINLMDDANLADDILRKKIILILDQEITIYKTKSLKRYGKIKDLLKSIQILNDKLYNFLGNLDNIIAEKAKELKKEVLEERKILKGYSDELSVKIKESRKLAAKIAFNTFKTINRKFHNLVLSADVGIIEVTWKNKTKLSKKILDYYSEKSNRTKILQNEFKEILGENR